MPNKQIAITMMLLMVAAVFAASPASAASHEGDELPPTVYEDPDIPPQAMDYNAETKMFPDHPGWYEGNLISYYKFRMYTPGSYSGFGPDAPNEIPIAPLYIPTTVNPTSGSADPWANIPEGQHPIIEEYATKDNEAYSDFVEVHWVVVGPDYEANDYDSHHDVKNNTPAPIPSGIYANVPVVPMGSWLEHPAEEGAAPIEPLHVWYEGHEVQTFAFETTDQGFADYFNPLTRNGTAAEEGSGFEIPVTPDMVRTGAVADIPIWHVNQYWTGVTPGENNGGPSANGQRNIINLDRNDEGYTPLWRVWWISKVPIGYQADQVRDNDVFTEENGFETWVSPMFVNCPNVGAHGGTPVDDEGKESFEANPTFEPGETFTIEGAIVMPGSPADVTATSNGTALATGKTNPMGGFALEISTDDLSHGENTITVTGPEGPVSEITYTVTVQRASMDGDDGGMDGDDGSLDGDDGEPTETPLPGALALVALLGALAFVTARRFE
ncbi:MAG: hypothetical protein R3185_02880 [Candidatus Thermoplasmatota archaeon]|nr:hypothetical protein [Candidatus Thermoplasmatota archaeon]